MSLPDSSPSAIGEAWRGLRADVLFCLRFYTRLPVPALAFETATGVGGFARASRVAPLAGLVVGGAGGASLALADRLGLPLFVAALLAVFATVALGGGLHEDGLADVADGFGGGRDRARKLAIMRDSAIGTFGTLALAASILLRVAALASLGERFGIGAAAGALAAACAASRGFGLMPMALLPAARADGLAKAAGVPPPACFAAAVLLSIGIGIALPALGGIGGWHAALATLLSALGSGAMTRWARRSIGGATGDVAGAAQQAAEVGFLLGLLISPRLG